MDFFTNTNILFFLAAYLIGSIPFGSILAKTFAGVDITAAGSKSIGATNVLRVVKETNPKLAKKLGIATVLLDALKGTLVLLVAMYYGVSDSTLWAIAILAVLGHCYSIYLGLVAVVVSASFLNDGLNVGSNVPMYIIAFIIIYKHIPNIIRIIKGEEKKVI